MRRAAVRRAAIVLLAWGGWLAVMTAIQAVFTTIRGPFGVHGIEPIMLGGSAAVCVTAGLVLWALDRRRAALTERPRMIADESHATATLIAGVALVLLGAGFGLWLILIGVGLTALGAGGLVREARARRRSGGSL